MFSTSKKKAASKEKPARKPVAKNIAPTLMSSDLHVSGDLATDGDMQIDGIIEGNIRSGSLTVGESAVVTGEIYADKVTILGKVTGRIRAREVELLPSARVLGDIWHELLSIASGAFLEGHCKHISGHESQAGQMEANGDAKPGEAVPLRYPKNTADKSADVVSKAS